VLIACTDMTLMTACLFLQFTFVEVLSDVYSNMKGKRRAPYNGSAQARAKNAVMYCGRLWQRVGHGILSRRRLDNAVLFSFNNSCGWDGVAGQAGCISAVGMLALNFFCESQLLYRRILRV